MSSREFNRDDDPTERAAQPADSAGISALVAHPESADIDFEPPRLGDEPVQPADFGTAAQ
jgi:hypothetical protein